MDNVLASMAEKGRERDYLLQVLGLWGWVAKTLGYTPEQVKAFSFRPEFLTREERRADIRRKNRGIAPLYTQALWHNCVRLHTGELKPMPLIKRPLR
jgi:hypothetical protein